MEQNLTFFTVAQQLQITEAIAAAEHKTSGEVRVHIETSCSDSVLDRSVHVFAELKMHQTRLRNGVLFYLAVEDHKFAVIGDAGINNEVPVDFWDSIKIKMQHKFRSGQFVEGIVDGIIMAGEKLKQKFPVAEDDVNELDDSISFGV